MEGMEDVDEKKGEKRNSGSGGWTYAGSTKSPHFGAVGGGKNGASTATNGTNGTGMDGMFGTR
jgi:hypothetical protein